MAYLPAVAVGSGLNDREEIRPLSNNQHTVLVLRRQSIADGTRAQKKPRGMTAGLSGCLPSSKRQADSLLLPPPRARKKQGQTGQEDELPGSGTAAMRRCSRRSSPERSAPARRPTGRHSSCCRWVWRSRSWRSTSRRLRSWGRCSCPSRSGSRSRCRWRDAQAAGVLADVAEFQSGSARRRDSQSAFQRHRPR